MQNYFLLAALVFAMNVMPAFAPPTWMVLVLYRLNSHLHTVPLVVIGALAASSGRYVLALGSRRFRSIIPKKALANLESAGTFFTRNKASAVTTFILFIFSPLPSAQLFEAAGLIGTKLVPLALAFFVGRLGSYSLYVAGASQLQSRNIGQVFTEGFASPWGIAVQLISLAGIYLLTRVNWNRFLPKGQQSKGES
jgi:membrane protein YqaA with SNARE-associated domain